MQIASVVLSVLLALVAGFSALGKLQKKPQIMESMAHVGVKPNQIPVLAYLELAGALGLLIGLAYSGIGLAAAVGLSLYFVGAVVAHLKTKDAFAIFAPALALALLNAVNAYLIASAF